VSTSPHALDADDEVRGRGISASVDRRAPDGRAADAEDAAGLRQAGRRYQAVGRVRGVEYRTRAPAEARVNTVFEVAPTMRGGVVSNLRPATSRFPVHVLAPVPPPARVTVWVPTTFAQQGRYMVSVLQSLGYQAQLRAVQLKPDPSTYYAKVLDSRERAQVGYFGWGADFTSPRDFIYPFSCAAFVPNPPQENSNPAAFCDRSIDAKIARAVAVQAQAPPAATLLWQGIERDILAQSPVVPTSNVRGVDFVSSALATTSTTPNGALSSIRRG